MDAGNQTPQRRKLSQTEYDVTMEAFARMASLFVLTEGLNQSEAKLALENLENALAIYATVGQHFGLDGGGQLDHDIIHSLN